ncbi:hypothetical protein [Streptomyces nigrescens]|uniref:hypothetical protein n=1 Tax=Streptomyces nigrescens TaxID=1920 RepID=UPI00347146F3
MRTTSTVAVYGADDTRFLHPEIQQLVGRRSDVLRALDISEEARTEDLVECVQRLRRQEEESGDRDVPAALILYEALAERTVGRGVGASGRCLCVPCCGRSARGTASSSQTPVDAGRASVCAGRRSSGRSVRSRPAVIKELAQRDRKQGREEHDGTTQSIVLQTLQMLAVLGRTQPGVLTAKRLGRLPLWTSQGWRSKRPVYAVEDPVVAEALGRERAVWCPGAELE